MSFGQLPEAMTCAELAEFSRVPLETVQEEAEAGRLPAYRIGAEWRILKAFLMRSPGPLSSFGDGPGGGAPSNDRGDGIQLGAFHHVEGEFLYVWPDRSEETYGELYEADAVVDGRSVRVRIGSTMREVAGLNRLKMTVFLDGVAASEFAGANDWNESGLVAGVIKPDGSSQRLLRENEPVPDGYRRFQISPYNQFIRGRNATSRLAVVCSRHDLETMARCALLRWASKQHARAER